LKKPIFPFGKGRPMKKDKLPEEKAESTLFQVKRTERDGRLHFHAHRGW